MGQPTAAGRARNGDTEIYYESFGSDGDPVLVLVNGLGSQCISYEEEFCLGFVDRGFRVIRLDNRDVGLSTKFDNYEPDVIGAMQAAVSGAEFAAPYLLSHMAADVMGVLDDLEIGGAHLYGQSMGGMIVQTVAIEHPDRVASMTSVMSTTGEIGFGGPRADVVQVLMTPPPEERDAAIARSIETSRVIGSPDHFDEDRARRRATEAYDRCFCPRGSDRQLTAVVASGDRAVGLKDLDVATLVIHGDSDPLIAPSGGERTAELVPGAELMMIDGMGHDLPPVFWSRVIDAVTRLAASSAGSPVL